MKKLILALACLPLSSCAGSSVIKISANTAIIQTSAAPVCGGMGAIRVAQKQAAIETIKSGYDRYIIVDAAGANNVSVSRLPGRYQTTGTATVYGNSATYSGSTTYVPGPTIVSGSHDQALAVRMFRNGEPGAAAAVSARDMLGPKWAEIVKSGAVRTCADG